MGGLIAIAYYANGRFTALETNAQWLKEQLTELLLHSENQEAKFFKNNSAVTLTTKGYQALARCGLRSYHIWSCAACGYGFETTVVFPPPQEAAA